MRYPAIAMALLLVVANARAQQSNSAHSDGAVTNGAHTVTSTAADYVPTMTFDVASVRETKQDPNLPHIVGGRFAPHSTTLHLENVQMYFMITMAYGVQIHQVQGIPNWGWTSFNVDAKSDSSADEKLSSLDDANARLEQQHMLQALLAERFHLQTHWATVESNVYHLVLARSGSKLLPAGSMAKDAEETKWLGDRDLPPLHQQGNGRQGYIFYGHNCDMKSLVSMVAAQMGRDVLDETGLTGKFDFRLQYSGRTVADNEKDDPTQWPPMMDALQDQLGLKLEPAKGQVKMLVVDHVEMPTAN